MCPVRWAGIAGEPPSIAYVDKTRRRGHQAAGSPTGPVGTGPHEQQLDDWLGDISDEDWSEKPKERVGRRGATPAHRDLAVPEGDPWRDPTADRPPQRASGTAADAHRAVIERRRVIAGLGLAVVFGLAVVIAVLLLRGGAHAPVTPGTQAAPTTPTTTATGPSSTPTTPSTAPTTTTPPTSSTGGPSGFVLPEGTKLRLGEGDPVVIKELQQALSTAGYEPGTPDGTFGPQTEAAVIAFQHANGLSPDGIVGPKTASALNSAVAGG